MSDDINMENNTNENKTKNNDLNLTDKIEYNNYNLKTENSSMNFKSKSNLENKLPLIGYRTPQLSNTLKIEKTYTPSTPNVNSDRIINNFYKSANTFCPPIPDKKNNIINNKNGKNSINKYCTKNLTIDYDSKKSKTKNNTYKVFIRPDGKPDFGNFPFFDDYVEFDPKKYKRPEIYFGFIHDQYIVPHTLGFKNNIKMTVEDSEKNNEKDIEMNSFRKSKSKKVKVKKKFNKKAQSINIKTLDEIMNQFNLKYIEPPPKEKKVEPPPEEIPPEEEEEKKDAKDTKDTKDSKNKGKKDTPTNKAKNTKDDKDKDKAKTNKTAKK